MWERSRIDSAQDSVIWWTISVEIWANDVEHILQKNWCYVHVWLQVTIKMYLGTLKSFLQLAVFWVIPSRIAIFLYLPITCIFFVTFVISTVYSKSMFFYKNCWRLELNRGPLVSEVNTLLAVSQPLPWIATQVTNKILILKWSNLLNRAKMNFQLFNGSICIHKSWKPEFQ